MLRSKDMVSADDPALSDGLWLSSISLSSTIVTSMTLDSE